jgi:hypothetical protein
LLKGRHANHLLLDYFPAGNPSPLIFKTFVALLTLQGNLTSSIHSPADLFWGQLGGCLECLDVGTTTVVDHAHMNYSPDHGT